MKKICIILLLALLVSPVLANEQPYEKIGYVMGHFLDSYASSDLTVKELPETVQFKHMTFTLTEKDKYMARYVDAGGYYQVDIWSVNGKIGFKLNDSRFGEIGSENRNIIYYIDWHEESLTEKQFAYFLLQDDAKKLIRVTSHDNIYEVKRLKYFNR